MSLRNEPRNTPGMFLRITSVGVALLATLACGDFSKGTSTSPTAPSGMFSARPTEESPVVRYQPPTIELNPPESPITPQPTPTPNPTSTPVPTPTLLPTPTPDPTATPERTVVPPPDPTATPPPTRPPEPTTRPTLAPVNTSAKSAETITTALGQSVNATVLGFGDSPLRFDQLVIAINEGERLLGVPYPSPSVTMRRVAEVSGGFCGINQMSYAPRYAGDAYVVDGSLISIRVDEDCDETFGTIAHEVAHSWFFGNDPAEWIDEGLANAVEIQVVANNREAQPIYPPVTYCGSYPNINELERGNPVRISEDSYTGFGCNYTLGDGIFGALREHYGNKEFNKRIGELARRGANRTNRGQTIADIRRVFGEDGKALDLVNLWYNGNPEMRKYRHMDAVDWIFRPTTDGDYLHFHGKTDMPEIVYDFHLGEHTYCSQFDLNEGIGDQEWVASVSRPLPAGWKHDEDSRVITINHHITPSTGEFRITAKILRTALANIGDLSLSVRERVTTGGDGICDAGINYAQVPVVVGRIPIEQKQARYFHLDAVEWTFPPTIDGEYLHFAGRTKEPHLVHNFVLGNHPFCSQFKLYRNFINQERVATVRGPLLAGWQHGEVPKIVVVNDFINPEAGEFSITARINDDALSGTPELSLSVSNRARVGADNVCSGTESYSQIVVSLGKIPSELKVAKHYHTGAIEWIGPPTINGNTLKFSGRADPGTINLEWKDGYCGQFSFYERDRHGYHYIDSLNPLLPGNLHWTGPITGEVTTYDLYGGGTFEATAKLADNALDGYQNPVLVVRTATAVDKATRVCGASDVLSAIDIR